MMRWFLRLSASGLVALAATVCAAIAADKPSGSAPWPAAVEAHYVLRYMGIDVGRLDVTSKTSGTQYSFIGNGKVSVLFGAITWGGNSSVSGTVDGGTPSPGSYAFDWYNNKKTGAIKMRFKSRTVEEVSVNPPPSTAPDIVQIKPAHKTGVLDPVSALMMLTKADGRPPCERRVGIFDGKQRYDLVFTFKGTTTVPATTKGAPPEPAFVCRAMYEPIAGHHDNEATKTYAGNRDVEVVMRRIAGTDMLIPYSVTVPTAWGTGALVTDRVDVVLPDAARLTLAR